MVPQRYDLGGGRELMCLATDRFKCEFLSLSFLAPGGNTAARKDAMVLTLAQHGTERYPTRRAISSHLDDMYSTSLSFHNRPFGDMQLLGMQSEFLGAKYVGGGSGLLPEVARMLSEVLTAHNLPGGVYPDEIVSLMRKTYRDNIYAARKNPRASARRGCLDLLLAGEACVSDHTAMLRALSAVTPRSLAAHFRSFCRRPLLFFYVGSTPGAEVAEILKNAFDTAAAAPLAYHSVVRSHTGSVRTGGEKMAVGQSQLAIGFRAALDLRDPAAGAAMLLNEIYGGSPASKLFLEVRERQGLCYHCASRINSQKGVIYATAGITANKRAVAEHSMVEQFYALQRGDLSDKEMEAAKKSLDFGFRQIYDSPSGLAEFYTRRAFLGIEETPEQKRLAIANLGKSDVAEVAGRYTEGAVYFFEGTKTEGGEPT